MKPILHARTSARKWGGVPEDYYPIHDFIDESKAHFADVRHRALLHNTWGCWLVERVFGHVATNSEGRTYSPRDVAEQHILEDLGRIPSVGDFLGNMALQQWMGGRVAKRSRTFRLED